MTDSRDQLVGIDVGALSEWLISSGISGGEVINPCVLAGGTQNIMIRFTTSDTDVILRRGPEHLRKGTNGAIEREWRILSALENTDVPHPRVIASCSDTAVMDGAAFYLMEVVDGYNPTVTLPPACLRDPDLRRSMGFDAVDVLSRLAAVDYEAVGLGDLGHPEGFLERQVPRWLHELEQYGRATSDELDVKGALHLGSWLNGRTPETFAPGLTHGDFHLANLLFKNTGPEVAAVVDWEMCTVGDPILDLGWLIATWPDPKYRIEGGCIGDAGNLPTPSELVTRYVARNPDTNVERIDWYAVLACFKLAVILEGTYVRACNGLAPTDVGAKLHGFAQGLIARGADIIETGHV